MKPPFPKWPLIVRWPGRIKPEFELFDLKQDPHELHNLADDPAHAGTLERLKQALADWRKEVHDPGVSEAFRKEGSPATYPSRNIGEWREKLHDWERKLGVPGALDGLR